MLSISQKWAEHIAARKAQAGLELVAFFAALLLLFSIAYVLLTSKTLSALDSQANGDALTIAGRAASEINAAVAEGGGYSKSFKMPDSIQGANYTVYVELGTVFVEWSGKTIVSSTVADNITGNFSYGWNTIQNNGGIIFVNRTA